MGVKRALKLLSLLRHLVKGDYGDSSVLMGEMHGLPQKLGQHFNLYNIDFSSYFETLCCESNEEIIHIEGLLKKFSLQALDYRNMYQASIGQVYRVETEEGPLALKVKYPAVEKTIKGDFRLLHTMLLPTRLLPLKSSRLLPFLKQLEEMLLEECSYLKEADRQNKFYDLFTDIKQIEVPEIVNKDTQAIASRWMHGLPLASIIDDVDEWFINTYFTFTIKSLMQLGMVHADPHPGNFIIRSDSNGEKTLIVLDFGSVAVFSDEEKEAAIRLLRGEYSGEEDLISDLGILGLDSEVMEVYRPIIPDIVSILFEPLYYPGEYDFSGWRLQYKLNTLLSSRTWERPLEIPINLLLLLRTFQGIYYYARKNNIVFNWYQAKKNILE